MTKIITTFTGDRAEIRPMKANDLPAAYRLESFDSRWHVCRWLGDSELSPPAYDCPAWVDRGRIFLPHDGQNARIDFLPEGPDAGIGRTW